MEKLQKFSHVISPKIKGTRYRSLIRNAFKKKLLVINPRPNLEFLEETTDLDRCVEIQRVFQSSIEELSQKFKINGLIKISNLLDESAREMKTSILDHTLQHDIFDSKDAQTKTSDDSAKEPIYEVKDFIQEASTKMYGGTKNSRKYHNEAHDRSLGAPKNPFEGLNQKNLNVIIT